MPNWCDTTYKCTGNKKSLKKLYETLNKLKMDKTPRVGNDFGSLWLGCVVDKLGGDWEKVACRGEVIDFSLNKTKDVLTIYQSTAWSEQWEFREFLEFTLPGIKIYYTEEEPGCDVYYTNDKLGIFFPDRYILDCDDGYNDVSYEYYDSLEKVIGDIEEFMGEKYTGERTDSGVEKYLDEWNSRPENEDEYRHCYIHKFEYSE